MLGVDIHHKKNTPYCIHSVLNGVILKFGQIKS